MPSISTSIFAFRYLSISVLLKNQEKQINILEHKIIRTETKNYYNYFHK